MKISPSTKKTGKKKRRNPKLRVEKESQLKIII